MDSEGQSWEGKLRPACRMASRRAQAHFRTWIPSTKQLHVRNVRQMSAPAIKQGTTKVFIVSAHIPALPSLPCYLAVSSQFLEICTQDNKCLDFSTHTFAANVYSSASYSCSVLFMAMSTQ